MTSERSRTDREARPAPSIAQLSFTLYDVDAAANLEFAQACHHPPYDAPPRHAPHIYMPRTTKHTVPPPPGSADHFRRAQLHRVPAERHDADQHARCRRWLASVRVGPGQRQQKQRDGTRE